MNQLDVASAVLAQASAGIVATCLKFVDFHNENETGRGFMEQVASDIGITLAEGREVADRNLPDLQKKILNWAEGKARDEISAAVREAEAEQQRHRADVDDYRRSHEKMVGIIKKRTEVAHIEFADKKGLLESIKKSHEGLLKEMEQSSAKRMRTLQENHRRALKHCFAGHFVPDPQAEELTNLYEVKQ